MRTRGFLVGASAGLLVALIFVGGAAILGPTATHLDLIQGKSTTDLASGQSYPATGQASLQPQAPTSQLPAATAPISSVGALSTASASSFGLLMLPILAGLLIGAAFYGVSTRKADAE